MKAQVWWVGLLRALFPKKTISFNKWVEIKMFWRECPRSPLPPVGGSLRAHVRYFGENPMGTCICSQERAEGSQNATARPSGRQLHHTLLCVTYQYDIMIVLSTSNTLLEGCCDRLTVEIAANKDEAIGARFVCLPAASHAVVRGADTHEHMHTLEHIPCV